MMRSAEEQKFIDGFIKDLDRPDLTRGQIFELFLVGMANMKPSAVPQREMYQVFMKCLDRYGPETMTGLATCAGAVLCAMPPKARAKARMLIDKQIDQFTGMFELLLRAAGMESNLNETDFTGF